MAHYTLSMTPIKRSDGRSATAAAAYRAGAEIADERTGVVHDYTRKRGVMHVELMAPEGIRLDSPEALWNAAESAEKNKRGRPAREVLIALPCELDADARLALAREMTQDLVERYGVAAQLAVHAPDRDGDQRNHHAHVLLTTRRYSHDGLGAKSQLEWSNTQLKNAGLPKAGDELKAMRARYGAMQNAALESADCTARVDHRSLAAQGIKRVPQIHVGNYGTGMIRQGTPEQSERAMTNLAIIDGNEEVAELRQQLAFENAEQHIEQRHQLQIWAEMRALESIQQRLDAERETQEQREWDEWISRPEVCSATGRIYTEAAVDACLERERALPENQPPPLPEGRVVPWPPQHDPELEMLRRAAAKQAARAAPKPSPAPTPQAPQEAAFDARARALEIVAMATPEERHAALHAASSLDLDDFDALSVELEPLMHAEGALTEEGQRLRDGLLPPDKSSTQRAERVLREQDWETRSGPDGPGF